MTTYLHEQGVDKLVERARHLLFIVQTSAALAIDSAARAKYLQHQDHFTHLAQAEAAARKLELANDELAQVVNALHVAVDVTFDRLSQEGISTK